MWVFLSDVHLTESNSKRGKKILSFFDLVKNDLEGLVILGDLFDFWFGYKTVVFNQFFPVLFKINEILEKGVRIIYIAGNHDFHFGPIFDKVIPIETYLAPCSIEINGKSIFLHHGDGIDRKEFKYILFKKIIRSKVVITISELIHPNLGWKIAKRFSKTSHRYFNKRSKRKRYLEACDDFVMKKYSEGYDVVIFGHLHFPFIKRRDVENKERIFVNLGDWINHDTFLKYDNVSGFELMHYVESLGKMEKYSENNFKIMSYKFENETF